MIRDACLHRHAVAESLKVLLARRVVEVVLLRKGGEAERRSAIQKARISLMQCCGAIHCEGERRHRRKGTLFGSTHFKAGHEREHLRVARQDLLPHLPA